MEDLELGSDGTAKMVMTQDESDDVTRLVWRAD